MDKLPNKFGTYGGAFVPETLMPALNELETAYITAVQDDAFQHQLFGLLHSYVGRPTPLTYAKRMKDA